MVKKKTSKWQRLKKFSKKVNEFGKEAGKEMGKGYGTFQKGVRGFEKGVSEFHSQYAPDMEEIIGKPQIPSIDTDFDLSLGIEPKKKTQDKKMKELEKRIEVIENEKKEKT